MNKKILKITEQTPPPFPYPCYKKTFGRLVFFLFFLTTFDTEKEKVRVFFKRITEPLFSLSALRAIRLFSILLNHLVDGKVMYA